MVASFALATAAGAQVVRGPVTVDKVRAIERAQFRDFWDDRGWSYRNNSPGSFWGDRRPSYPNRSYDPYTPYRRQQVYESNHHDRLYCWRLRLAGRWWLSAHLSV
jgi:hypothetical protein